ncbi:C-terminal binding protein [Elioraea sp.]|uniref:C-terminal binding protein n=1 Tax=Elioraea sp. TaxID=2185103 RepID=UPI0025BDBA6A|nr:C-terminal binding protein [Elioraea sp.]
MTAPRRVLILDPQFTDTPDIERAVLGPGPEIAVWRPDGAAPLDPAVLAGAEVVINCRSRHRIPAAFVARMDQARLVVQAGVGFNHIDLEACAARAIAVCNTPDYGTMEVADHALALMLTLMRGTAAHDARLRARESAWATTELALPPVRRLRGLVFGIVGLGRIGLAAGLRARGFGLDVAFHDPGLPPGAELSMGFRRHRTLAGLLAEADIVSLHCPMTEETAGLISGRTLALMKRGAVLINTARGGIVDLDAVDAALRTGQLGAAGLDVLPTEPPDRSHPLIAAWAKGEAWLEGRLIITPHAAFYTPESLADMRRLSAQAAADYLNDGTLRACVNLDALRRHGNAPA